MSESRDRLLMPLRAPGFLLTPLGDRIARPCARPAPDPAIWPLYATSYAPARFDARFDALLANPGRLAFAVSMMALCSA